MSIPWSKEHYHLRDGKVRWRGYELKGADVASFEPLNHIWARDVERVYTQHSVNKLADRETFEVLNHIYAKDKNRVFYLSGWIKEADARTFHVLDEGRFPSRETAPGEVAQVNWTYAGFACDARQVFHQVLTIGKPCALRGAAPQTFQALRFGYGEDGSAVFYEKHKLKKANPAKFRVLNHYFSTDGKTVYYLERAMSGAEAETFEVLGEYWARDTKGIYFQENAVPLAERATFRLIDFNFGRDRQRVYGFLGEVLDDADPNSFKRVGSSLYYSDRRSVYYNGYPGGWVQGSDPTSFEAGPGHNEGRDRAWWYQGSEKKKPRDAPL